MNPSPRSTSLKLLFQDFPFRVLSPVPEAIISGIAIDSRRVQPGDLFVAMTGGTLDGHQFIPGALERGAAAIVGERAMPGAAFPYVQVENSRRSLSYLAAAFYGYPSRELVVVGVTGTDGKTTTINLIFQILKSAGLLAGMISTVNAVIGEEVLDTGFHVTTPDAQDVQDYLARMVASGLTHAILETTSHGLAQHRVDAVEFDAGVITNITHEHLNEHGTLEAYRAAKARLFTMLGRKSTKKHRFGPVAVLNRDDVSFEYLSGVVEVPTVTFGLRDDADVRARQIVQTPSGLDFYAVGKHFAIPVHTNLVGDFNVSNCLAALALTVEGLGVDPEAARAGIAAFQGVPGRMERIDLGQDFTTIVDFAHTPNALQAALKTARRLVSGKGRIIVVFGSAGQRDREKRRLMAEVAARLADVTILTAEDPRTESLEAILAEMAAGLEDHHGVEGRDYWRIPDRGEAIRFALSLARPGDLVMACGKGHEQSMCFGTTEYAWDDRQAMRAALAELRGIPGPRMPFLPTQGGKILS